MSPARSLVRVHSSDQPETLTWLQACAKSWIRTGLACSSGSVPPDQPPDDVSRRRARRIPSSFQFSSAAARPGTRLRLRHWHGNTRRALPAGAWPNWVLGNHDQTRSRLINRVGGPAQARLAAMLLLTLRGTPTLYYGGEYREHSVGPHVLSYERIASGRRVLVALNFGAEPRSFPVRPGVNLVSCRRTRGGRSRMPRRRHSICAPRRESVLASCDSTVQPRNGYCVRSVRC